MRFRFDVFRLEELERGFDSKLGGPITRPYRDLLCYCLGRLIGQGAQLEDVKSYIDTAYQEAFAAMEPDDGREAGQS